MLALILTATLAACGSTASGGASNAPGSHREGNPLADNCKAWMVASMASKVAFVAGRVPAIVTARQVRAMTGAVTGACSYAIAYLPPGHDSPSQEVQAALDSPAGLP